MGCILLCSTGFCLPAQRLKHDTVSGRSTARGLPAVSNVNVWKRVLSEVLLPSPGVWRPQVLILKGSHTVHCAWGTFPVVGACGWSWAVWLSATLLCSARQQRGECWGAPAFLMLGVVPLVVNMYCCVLSFILSHFNWGEVRWICPRAPQWGFQRCPRMNLLRESLILGKCCLATHNAQSVQNVEVWLYLCFFCLCLSANAREHWWSLSLTFTESRSIFHIWAEYAGLWFPPPPWSTDDTSNYTYRIEIQSRGSSSRNQTSSVTRAVITDINPGTFYNVTVFVGVAGSVTEGKEIFIKCSRNKSQTLTSIF